MDAKGHTEAPRQGGAVEGDEHASQQYVELYKLAVEMADRVSARRATANAFFLTVNTALLAFVSSGLDAGYSRPNRLECGLLLPCSVGAA